MRSKVYETVECLSAPPVCPFYHSTAAAACGGFAAKRRTGRRYRSTTAAAGRPAVAAPQHWTAIRRSAVNASSVTLTADVGS